MRPGSQWFAAFGAFHRLPDGTRIWTKYLSVNSYGICRIANHVSSLFLGSLAIHNWAWGAAQTGTVTAARGSVQYSQASSGVAVVTADNAGFLARVLKGGAVT